MYNGIVEKKASVEKATWESGLYIIKAVKDDFQVTSKYLLNNE